MRSTTIPRGCILGLLALIVLAPGALAQAPVDKALNQPASASSIQTTSLLPASETCIPCTAGKGNDGNSRTRWGSAFADPSPSWQVDLGSPRLVDTVAINWEASFASSYRIEGSLDGAAFTPLAPNQAGSAGVRTTRFAAVSARYVRVTGLAKANADKGISFWSAQVLGPADPPPASTPQAAASPIRLPDAGAPAAPRARLLSPFPVIRIRGSVTATGARIALLTVRAPRGARIEARCRGRSCPVRRIVLSSRRLTRVRALERDFRSGTVIEVLVTRRGRVGKYTRFRVRSGRAPARTDGCATFAPSTRARC